MGKRRGLYRVVVGKPETTWKNLNGRIIVK